MSLNMEENLMNSNVHTDPRCIMVQDALNFVDGMDVQDVLKKLLYAEACAYFWNFVSRWEDAFERPVYNYLDVIVDALNIYIQTHPSELATQCKNEIVSFMNL